MSIFAAIVGLTPQDKGTILFGLVMFAIVAVPCAIHYIFTMRSRYRELKKQQK